MLKIFNTLHKKIEEFKPLKKGWFKKVGLYTCGPTVYNYAHIGNLRTYVFEDILKRTLEYNGYKVKHVMNITDVGHLTSDADTGEDKLEKGAAREHKTVWEIAKFYTAEFQKNLRDLNILEPNIWCKATDHIKEQIKLVQKLIDKKYTYETADGIYFDTTKLADYGKLANLKAQELKAGARVDLGQKKNPHDFALWKFSPSANSGLPSRQMEWDAFGKKGFPGWHIECSAMAEKYLGVPFDTHCGGVDHIPVHHTNEIAQTKAATGKLLANFWLHGEFLVIGADKMAKSGENFITLETLKKYCLSPIAYRYWLLQTHYRKQLTFSWEALEAAERGLEHLYEEIEKLRNSETKRKINDKMISDKFLEAINDDLDTPRALAIIWEGLKNNQISYKTLLKFDEVLGLKLKKITKLRNLETKAPNEVQILLDARKQARKNKNWEEADRLREEIRRMGFEVEDTDGGQKLLSTKG